MAIEWDLLNRQHAAIVSLRDHCTRIAETFPTLIDRLRPLRDPVAESSLTGTNN